MTFLKAISRSVLIIFTLILSHSNIYACSCAYIEEVFCRSIFENQSVILAEVKGKATNFGIEIKILEHIDSDIEDETIIIQSYTSCSENLDQFSTNDTLILALNYFTDDDVWELFGVCSRHFLRIKDGQVTGQINDTLTIQSYDNFVEDYTSCIELGLVSVDDIHSREQALRIMPNPTSNTLSINVDQGIMRNVNIYNSSGQLVLKQQVDNSSSEIFTSELEGGLYFIQVYTNDKSFVQQFLKI